MPSRSGKRLPWGTLRVRLAIWNTAVVLTMTVAALAAARLAARATLYDGADAELRAGAREVVLALRDLFPDMDAVVAEMRRKAASHEERGWFTQLLTEDGKRIWTSEHCPEAVATYPPHNLTRDENIVQVGPYRYVRLRIEEPGQPNFHVRVGTYTTGLEASLSHLVRVLLVVGAALCGLTPLAGWWLAVRSTRPVSDILATADRLDPSRLTDRLPSRSTGDELDHLSHTINGLLDDVAAHVDRQRQFLADAAHELRSPLAAMQSSLEVALSQDRAAEDYRVALGDVLDESRHLAKLTNGLLLLAEADADAIPVTTQPFDLAGIAHQAVAMFAGVAEERGVALSLDRPAAPVAVPGDGGQFRQVIGNLLDNALRFTPAGGAVRVTVGRTGDAASLTVADTGAGIAAEHLPRLFDRFYKVDPARSRHDGEARGGGLGLPICRAIAERHGGTIAVTSSPGRGTTVTVHLPGATTTPGSPHSTQPAETREASRGGRPDGMSARCQAEITVTFPELPKTARRS